MMRPGIHSVVIPLLCVAALLSPRSQAADDTPATIPHVVSQAIHPIMQQYRIPGMAIGIVTPGQSRVFNYGVASLVTGKPVTSETLFEIGSVSKTFTATLASYALLDGRLSLSDSASKYLPSLRGSSFDKVSLLDLGTHMSGGLPLQVPDGITNNDQLMAYFRNWKPDYAPGTYRTYSNVSIGLLGMITANSMNGHFNALIEREVFSGLGMQHTYLDVPKSQVGNYAQGYTRTDAPVRMAQGVLASEAYGIRTTAEDMLRFIKANMRMLPISPQLQRAITDTHMGYFRVGPMTQDLIWEQYDYPVKITDLLAGNSDRMLLQANPSTRLDPPLQPSDHVLIDKTGSTNGFSAYVAFVPAEKLGIVLLANKNYPIDARVTAAYEILTRLERTAASGN